MSTTEAELRKVLGKPVGMSIESYDRGLRLYGRVRELQAGSGIFCLDIEYSRDSFDNLTLDEGMVQIEPGNVINMRRLTETGYKTKLMQAKRNDDLSLKKHGSGYLVA